MEKITRAIRQIPITFVRLYRLLLSPYWGMHCRFYPTCSHYAIEAYESFGVIKGTKLTLARLLKCQPFHRGGEDFVPKNASLCNKKGSKK